MFSFVRKALRPAPAACVAVLAALLVVTASPRPARAAWSTQSAVNTPICTARGVQSLRSAVSDGAGGMLIVWADTRSDSLDIYAQHLDAGGNAVWTPNGLLICDATGDQDSPVIASDGAGGAVIAWRDQRGSATADIYVQRIGPGGNALWTANGVKVCGAPDEQANPVVIGDAGAAGPGGAIVAWEDWRSGVAIYAQRLNAAGVAQWTSDGIPLGASPLPQFSPVIAGDGGGPGDAHQGAYVVWTQQGGSGYDIVGQHVTPDALLLWDAAGTFLCGAPANQFMPVLAAAGPGGVTAAWEDHRGATAAIFTQRVDWWGHPRWTADGVAACPGGALDQTQPTIAADTSGGTLLAWHDSRGGDRVYTQHVDALGTLLWPAAGVAVCTASGGEMFPTMTGDGAGGALLAWEDTRAGPSSDLYAQRLNGSAARLWSAAGRAVTTAAGAQYQPIIVATTDTVGIVAWTDQRTSGSDLFAQRMPYVVTLEVPGGLATLAAAPRVAPNPARAAVRVSFALAAPVRVRFEALDAAGRVVRALDAGTLAAGPHALEWDGHDERGAACAPGVYFVRVLGDGVPSAARMLTLRR